MAASLAKMHRTRAANLHGFTMVELITAMFLASVLTAIAVPVYRTYVDDQRMRAISADLHIALTVARSEAVKRARAVVVNPSDDGWGTGWSIPSPTPGEPNLLNHVQGGTVAIAGPGQVQFNAFGRAAGEAEFEIDVGSAGDSIIRCMTMQTDGRIESIKGGCPDDA